MTRLEGQVVRYKSAAENAEKVEDELKAEKRKMQREVEFLTQKKKKILTLQQVLITTHSVFFRFDSCDQLWIKSTNSSQTTATFPRDSRRWSRVVAWHRLRRNSTTHQLHLLLSRTGWSIGKESSCIHGFLFHPPDSNCKKNNKKKEEA